MTKGEFTAWLQDLVNTMDAHGEIGYDEGEYDCGDVWRKIEDQDLLEAIGVQCAWDCYGQVMLFKCTDGYIASRYSIAAEGNTEWWFDELDVTRNLRDATENEVDTALGHARVAVLELEQLLKA